MIQFRHVSKRYPGAGQALADVSFEVQRGEMVFLTGHSGAGKTTVLRLIMAIERPSGGEVLVAGTGLASLSRRQIPFLRRRIGCVFQEHRLLLDRSVYDNVALPLEIAGYTAGETARRVRAALDQVDLLGKERLNPVVLSGGEQQRVGIARAVVGRPPILLADEPTGNLDPELSREIFSLFDRFSQLGVTVLIASHNLELVASMRGRVLTLREGSLMSDRRLAHA